MNVELHSGPARIIASGSATCFLGNDLNLAIVADAQRFVLELVFSTDPDTADVAIDTVSLDDGLRLHCVNFDRADGRGSAVPVALGSCGEDVIFVHFRVFRYGRTVDRTVHYTFFRAPRTVLDPG